MINVKTIQIEGYSREKFYTQEQAWNAMPVLIGKLVEGDSYNGPSNDLTDMNGKNIVSREKTTFDKYIELGAGYETTVYEDGFGIETSYRQMLGSTFGLGVGVL